ncbi:MULTISPECIES: flagellar basal body P-ring protein FlgI [unclassified Nitratiruptor]|uniref:flagellar basal body P-ring protein FlgI n=1 Tax=unclassified Nitratiruptor TaxID=2624044 RepID=UPI001915DAAE|nr:MULTISPECIES: flagellar basal body P-ring protein FlgI [unclassified Nitratiruptor]BCD59913.1 flagellar P-ring protein precursor FlgI [Nitratiruptor sp. YY08-10]BCD63836.1 flagellar P-ring protein precursor FlgI [Nitratiruptor sp. YY08-14]
MRLFFLLFFILFDVLWAVEIKIGDQVNVVGVRENYLTGYGIVVGLNGTGDGTTTKFTLLSIANMLKKMGINIDPKDVKTKNAAAVIVTAKLPPFAKSGMTVDVTVSSMGDAKDIGNGVLIRTPLFGPDKKIYAFAQGPTSTGGGFSESNKGGKVQKNFTTTALIPNGAIIERDLPYSFDEQKTVTLTLKHPSFEMARRIVDAINKHFKEELAFALDASTIRVLYPMKNQYDKVQFLSQLLDLKVQSENEPTIVIYERTGTVIMSGDIKIDTPVYISHGSIYVTVQKEPVISQPNPLAGGKTVQTQSTQTTVQEANGRIFSIRSPSLKDLVKALNDLGISPRDLIAIIQAIKNAGKLHAKIVIM